MIRPLRGATARYALIQALYWAVYCLMAAFASVFLLDRGFTNAQIGSTLGASYLLSAALQPALAGFFLKRGVRLNRGIAGVYVLITACAMALRFLSLGHAADAVLMAALLGMQSAMQPSVNALSQSMENGEEKVDFGLARGVGSAAYALSSFLMGRLLAHFAPSILPLSYGLVSAALIAVLLGVKTSAGQTAAARDRRETSWIAILRAKPMIGAFLGGVACMFLAYSFIDAFLLQIIASKGGDSANLGVAITISAMTELPAMLLFSRLSRKGLGLKIFTASVWFWLLRDVFTLLAPTPQALYAVQLLNFLSVAVYVPGMMEYLRGAMPEGQLLLGTTMAGMANMAGNLGATFAGGWLLDAMGVRGALGIAIGFAACGTAMLTAALLREQKRRAQMGLAGKS